jgi:Skp family chaperone for outer membrane proteins
MSRWLVLGIFLLGSTPITALAEEVKLGYVDMQRALNETEDGRKAKANLKKVFDQKQKELDEQQEELNVQKSHLHETEAAIAAIREARGQAAAEYRHIRFPMNSPRPNRRRADWRRI